MRAAQLLTLCLFILGCKNSKEKEIRRQFISDGITHIVSGDIDTSVLIEALNIVENKADFSEAHEKLDTITLEYKSFACDCPQWQISSYDTGLFLDIHYYIEPKNVNLELPRLLVAGTRVKFIGKEYKELRYPNNAKFTDLNPPKGKVFRYFSYEVLKPYKVWAARKFDYVDLVSGDSSFIPIQVTVR